MRLSIPTSPDRRFLPLLCIVPLLLAAGSCRTAPEPEAFRPSVDSDPHSFANIEEVTVKHIDLDLDVDFTGRRLTGSATLELSRSGAERLVLDTRDLDIHSVTLDNGEQVEFVLGESDPLLGSRLEIPLALDTQAVTVAYATDPGAEALQWLAPELTAGGDKPFLFSQSQAILARTWVPCQDTPAVRMTYDAAVQVPPGLMAVMSAENATAPTADGMYQFSMRQPIPSYLLALAVGDLEFREIGPRSGVYAAPSVVEAAAWEFADTEKMITAAERLYGPYPWERYDLLVLPPSFPWGGMENPRLTFATPTILAGDRSLVALVAHELAHSWSGNLVTNATWNDFWLNEGFTSYIENRVMEELYGADYAEMLTALDVASLRETLEKIGLDSADSRLVLDLESRNPDDGMTDVAYNKGASFLRVLEHLAGRERWDAYLRSYFAEFSFRSIDTATFLDHLRHNLLVEMPELEERARIEEWIYGTGLPENLVEPEPAAFARVEDAIAVWLDGSPAAALATGDWNTHQWLHFLRGLPDDLTSGQMSELDAAFGFTASGNSEVLVAWLALAIDHDYRPARPALEGFLVSVGRIKFLYPLYSKLAATEGGLAWAREIYGRARAGYHPVTIGVFDRVLDWPQAETSAD